MQNSTLENGDSQVRQSKSVSFGGGGGGALFDLGGQLKVVSSRFLNNRCYQSGPDLGGAVVRALAQRRNHPGYLNKDTFSGGRCSNGGTLSSIGVSWVVLNSLFTNNRAIGFGANPAASGTAGGGSGGSICTDGNKYSVRIEAPSSAAATPARAAAPSSTPATTTPAPWPSRTRRCTTTRAPCSGPAPTPGSTSTALATRG